MKKLKIIVSDRESDETLFEIWLNKNLITFDGTWTCLPGYLPKTQGYFSFRSSSIPAVEGVDILDFEYTTIMSLKNVITRKDNFPTPYITLFQFPAKPKIGMKGDAHIYQYGTFEHTWYYDKSPKTVLKWKVAEIY